MPYAVEQDIIDRYGETFHILSFDKDADEAADEDVVTNAIADATAEIDSYVGSRYSLPLDETPDILKRLCVDIAVYRGSAEAGTVTDEKRRRYDDALAWLKDLAKGVASLGSVEEPASITGSAELVAPNTRIFTRTTMRGLW